MTVTAVTTLARVGVAVFGILLAGGVAVYGWSADRVRRDRPGMIAALFTRFLPNLGIRILYLLAPALILVLTALGATASH
jgi:hypothetical protein